MNISPKRTVASSFKRELSIKWGVTVDTLTVMFPYLQEISLYRDQSMPIFANRSPLHVTTLRWRKRNTLLCLIVRGSNKMHQGENYQYFLNSRGTGGGGGISRSGFFLQNLQFDPPTIRQKRVSVRQLVFIIELNRLTISLRPTCSFHHIPLGPPTMCGSRNSMFEFAFTKKLYIFFLFII